MRLHIDEARYNKMGLRRRTDRGAARLREEAYQAIKEAILNGALGPDLPLVEERLASVLGISRTPIREALAILEHEGLIEPVPYKGVFVKVIPLDNFLSMYEALEAIEPVLASRAAERADGSDIAAMEDALITAERFIPGKVSGHLSACRAFQRRMGQCAGNAYLTGMLLSIEERSDLYLLHLSAIHPLPADKMHAAVENRRTILDAICAGDPELAAQAAQAHARAVRVRWREMYPDRGAMATITHALQSMRGAAAEEHNRDRT